MTLTILTILTILTVILLTAGIWFINKYAFEEIESPFAHSDSNLYISRLLDIRAKVITGEITEENGKEELERLKEKYSSYYNTIKNRNLNETLY